MNRFLAILLLTLSACASAPERSREEATQLGPLLVWTSNTGQLYFIERADFDAPNTWTLTADDIPGVTGELTNSIPEPALYRVGTRPQP